MDGKPSKHITYEHGFLHYQGRLWIPESSNSTTDIGREICEVEHDSQVAGHMGMDKTVDINRKNLFWPQMHSYIEDYVRSCDSCECNKAGGHVR